MQHPPMVLDISLDRISRGPRGPRAIVAALALCCIVLIVLLWPGFAAAQPSSATSWSMAAAVSASAMSVGEDAAQPTGGADLGDDDDDGGSDFWYQVGKLHFVVLHFPIALLLAAMLSEILGLASKTRDYDIVTRFCLFTGALGSLVTAPLGWIDAGMPNWTLASFTSNMGIHRWLGTLSAVLAVALALWVSSSLRRARRAAPAGLPAVLPPLTNGQRYLLYVVAMLTGVAAHFGGIMVHN